MAVVATAIVGLGGAVALGLVGVSRVSSYLLIFIVWVRALALGYNLFELFTEAPQRLDLHVGGAHSRFSPRSLRNMEHSNVSAFVAGAYAALISSTSVHVSTPARDLRRRNAKCKELLSDPMPRAKQ